MRPASSARPRSPTAGLTRCSRETRRTARASSRIRQFSPRLPVLAAAMNDGFGFWDLRTGDPLAVQAWPGGVNMVRFEESGELLVHGPRAIAGRPREPASPGVWRYGPPEAICARR